MRRTFTPQGAISGLILGAAVLALAGCGSTPPADITLATPAPASASTPEKVGDLSTERIKWASSKPGCEGDCPRIEIDSVAFPGIPKLTALVDHVLAYMTGTDANRRGPYDTLSEYTQYFWSVARARDATYFKASVKDTVGDIVAVELHTEQFLTGAAHGIPATQYLNWERSRGRVMSLEEALIPGRHPQYVAALRQAHAKWLAGNLDARRDPAAYNKMWPFQESDNYALTRDGVVVKYDAYSIAPYSHGEPELSIPYSELRGILKPELLPAS
ncbi:lipoprotein [Achromobacter xylosoxidans]|nr:lipoprotein [Achromobacter xylosoxidans]